LQEEYPRIEYYICIDPKFDKDIGQIGDGADYSRPPPTRLGKPPQTQCLQRWSALKSCRMFIVFSETFGKHGGGTHGWMKQKGHKVDAPVTVIQKHLEFCAAETLLNRAQ
jgi:hypothetical protein